IDARLKELPRVDSFPEGGVERLDLLQKQRRALEEERGKKEHEAEVVRLRRIQMHVDPEDCERRAHILESLRRLLPRMDAARRIYLAGQDRRDAVMQERRALAAGLVNLVPPSSLAFGLFIALIWIGVFGLILANHSYIGAGLGTVSVL